MAVKDGAGYRISATPAIILAHLLGLTAVALMLVWILRFRNGLSLSTSNLQRLFNAHPFFMILGLIFLGGQAIMAYKTVPATRRVRKFVHSTLHLSALVLGVLGLYAVFKFKRELKQPDMITLHSWLGIGAIGLYTLQLLFGFFFFVSPGTSMTTRANYLPWHAFFGLAIFLLAVATAETGLVERFLLLGLARGSEALVVNFTGVAIFLFGISVILSVILPRAY